MQRSFGHSLIKLGTVDYLTEDQLKFVDKDLTNQLKGCAINVSEKKMQTRSCTNVCGRFKIRIKLFTKMV